MRNMRHNTQKKHYIAALCLVLAALSLSVTAFVAAKYSSTVEGNAHGVIPASFQLECTPYEDGHEYFVVAGTPAVSFDVTSTVVPTVTLDNNVISQDGETTYTYTIPTTGWQVGETHTVTVATTVPYAKTITFTLRVIAADASSTYSITKFASRVELTLNIGSTVPENVTINYGTLAPDNLNELMKDWKTETKSAILDRAQLTPHSQYTLIFFGTSNMTDVASAALIDDTTINLIVPAQAQTAAKNGAPASQ